jgi:hypothetical protein
MGSADTDSRFNVQLGALPGVAFFHAVTPASGWFEFFSYDGRDVIQLSTDIQASDDSVYIQPANDFLLLDPEAVGPMYVTSGSTLRTIAPADLPMQQAVWSGRVFAIPWGQVNPWTEPPLSERWATTLYRYTDTEIREIADLEILLHGGRVSRMVVTDGEPPFFFVETPAHAAKLYVLEDGTLRRISNTSESETTTDAPSTGGYNSYWDSSQRDALRYGDSLYLTMRNARGAEKLFAFDGTRMAQVTNTTDDQRASDGVSLIAVVDGMLYFDALDKWGESYIYRLCDLELPCKAALGL